MQSVRLQEHDFSVDEELAALRSPYLRMGGIATFIGCARNFSVGHDVERIEFDAYPSMAIKVLIALREEALLAFQLLDARIVHRIGVVRAGEQIVFIATGAEHRAPALHACEWLINELKQRVPIWKKEVNQQGETWVTPHP
jgi:molybdopterin synthase catalytic subunit